MSAHGDTLCRVTSLSAARYWSVVGHFIDNETKRRGWTDIQFATSASLSRATIARLKAGAPLGDASLAKIEGALGLPRDLLTYIALGDESEIADAVATSDPDLMRWLGKKFAEADRLAAVEANVQFQRGVRLGLGEENEAELEAALAAREAERSHAKQADLDLAARRGPKSQVETPEQHAE